MEFQGILNTQNLEKREQNWRPHIFFISKLITNLIKAVWWWHKDRHRTLESEGSEISHHIHGQMNFDRVLRLFNGKNDSHFSKEC